MKIKKIILSIILAVMGVFLIRQESGFKLIVCDVGQGNGVLMEEGRLEAVYDFGPENKKMLTCLEKYMPLGDKEIEVGILSHWDTDHSGGLVQVEDYYKIDRLFSAVPKSNNIEQMFYTEIVTKGDVIRLGMMEIEIKSPGEIVGDSNRDSIIAEVSYKGNKFLLMGDVTAEEEQTLAWRNELDKVEGIVVSHHGSALATSQELLTATKPIWAAVSVGAGNKYGLPTEVVLDRLAQNGIQIRRTDHEGDLVWSWR